MPERAALDVRATRTSASVRNFMSDGIVRGPGNGRDPARLRDAGFGARRRATDRQILEGADHLTVSSSTTCTATSKLGTNDVENGMTRYAY